MKFVTSTSIIIVTLVVLNITLIVYVAYTLTESRSIVYDVETGVPQNVANGYKDLGETYKDSLGTSLILCDSTTEESLYVVSGSGGFSGQTLYYSSRGKLIDTWEWTDVNPPTPPIDTSEESGYTCTTLEEYQGS